MLNREKTLKSVKENNIFDYIGINIQELPFVEKINLRLDPNNKNFVSSCEKILEILLPTKSNTLTKNEKINAIWLGPDEWLITNKEENNLLIKLKNQIGDVEASVTDVSENRTVIRIFGEKIYILLSKFLTLDLEKNLPNQYSCTQTLFVKVPVLLVRNNNDYPAIPEIDIFTNRSHADYVYKILVDGAENLDF